ncbi:MAG TPA: hypothetical protein VGE27_10845 [Gemmatimonas sp.]|uniref:hypothetical protein n=1 Tax=Gemmatimonas sp. TaxID=1962908 RepID=UPI002ED87D1B
MCSRARLLVFLLFAAASPIGVSAQERQVEGNRTFQSAAARADTMATNHIDGELLRDTLESPVGDPSTPRDSASGIAVVVTTDTIDGLAAGTPDSLAILSGAALRPIALRRLSAFVDTTPQDTVRRRPRAVQYSDGYGTRLMIHRTLSWAMLPLFAASYFSGDQILKEGSDAPKWARNLHRPAATSTAVLFGANTVTGVWNLWEGRHDPNGRKRRFLHAALFMAASGGFTYAGTKLADDAEQSDAKRRQHRNVNLVSMGVSTASWLIMLVGN